MRILLTRMKFIGDVVLTTPHIRAIHAAHPDAYIAYMGDRHAVSLLEGNPALGEIIPFDYERPALLEQARVVRLLRSRRFDVAIDLFGNPRSALLTRLSGAPVRVGPERKGRGRLYTVRVRDDGAPKSAIQFHDMSLRAAGFPAAQGMPEIFLTNDERARAADLLRTLGADPAAGTLVGLHPGATWPAKRWAPGRFASLADRLAAEDGCTVLLTGGPRDEEVLEEVRKQTRAQVVTLAGLPLRTLAAALSHLSAYVANDNGTMHIAAAVGTPTVGIFGPGEENIWFPYRRADGHLPLRRDVPCHPCHLDFCNREGDGFMECMHLLAVGDVLAAVHEARSRHARGG